MTRELVESAWAYIVITLRRLERLHFQIIKRVCQRYLTGLFYIYIYIYIYSSGDQVPIPGRLTPKT